MSTQFLAVIGYRSHDSLAEVIYIGANLEAEFMKAAVDPKWETVIKLQNPHPAALIHPRQQAEMAKAAEEQRKAQAADAEKARIKEIVQTESKLAALKAEAKTETAKKK